MPSADPAIVRALSVRQPYAEQILRREKWLEYRSTNTNVRERVFLYASMTPADDPEAWNGVGVPSGMLPTGVLVGSVEIVDSTYNDELECWQWHLAHPRRLAAPVKPKGRAGQVFWRPEVPKAALKWEADSGLPAGVELIYHLDLADEEMFWSMMRRMLDIGVLSQRCEPDAVGRRVWVVVSSSATERSYLAGWLEVESVESPERDEDDKMWLYKGTTEHVASAPKQLVEIGKAPWFEGLRRYLNPEWEFELTSDQQLLAKLENAWKTKRA